MGLAPFTKLTQNDHVVKCKCKFPVKNLEENFHDEFSDAKPM